jgi:apolipoprotein N-acyltransferase
LLLVRRLARRSLSAAVFGTAALWTLVEIARSVVPILYFTWLLLGHSLLYNAQMRQAADLLGVYGLSFLIAAFNAWLAFAFPEWLPMRFRAIPGSGTQPAWRYASILLALTAGVYFYGAQLIERLSRHLKPGPAIGLIQGNIATKLGRTNRQLDEQFIRHMRLHRQVIEEIKAAEGAPPALVCWAETMVPGSMNADAWGAVFQSEVKRSGIPTLAGCVYTQPEDLLKKDEDKRNYNAAFVFDAEGREVMRYYKRRLVAFGEYIPGGRDYAIMSWLRSVTSDRFVPGLERSAVKEAGGYNIALNLCVEDIHPALAREAAYDGADTLVNVTNDGWFYGTYGPRAHLLAAAWRAIETRRPLLRVTNTGYTAAVDPLGNIEVVVPIETEAVGCVHLKRIDGGSARIVTPYMRLGEFWTALIFAIVLILAIGRRRAGADRSQV